MKSVLIVATTLLLTVPSTVEACSCAVMEVDAARSAAAFVFEGTVVRFEETNSGTHAVFRVRRVWKGSVAQEITLRVPGRNSMCPPHFAEGQTYIVYAENTSEGPHVGACARYGAGQSLSQERRQLGRPVRTHRRHVPPPG